MKLTISRGATVGALMLGLLASAPQMKGQTGAKNGEWPDLMGGDLGNTRLLWRWIRSTPPISISFKWRGSLRRDNLGPSVENNLEGTQS